MPDVVIVDDEPLARQGMRQLLAAHADVRLIGEAASAREAVDLIRKTNPDVVFLDVQMADASGFDVLRHLASVPAIIFVSAHKEHAVEAFAVHAIDYLLKPVRPERLAAALARLRAGAAPRTAQDESESAIQFRTGQKIVAVRPSMIAALHAEGDYTKVSIADALPLLIGQSLSDLDAALPHPPFLRLGRSLIVNLDRIRMVHYLSRDRTHLDLEGLRDPIRLGRAATAIMRRTASR